LTSPPMQLPTWGAPPPRPYIDERRADALDGAANMLVVAAVLHIGAGALSWLLLTVVIQGSPTVPGLTEILYVFAVVGLVGQVSFAAIAGAGWAMIPRGGTNVAVWGTGLLVVGIIAAIFSLAIFGGFIGLIAGILTAYAGNKVRKPPTLAWIPPSSWIPPPQPPAPPPSP